MHDQIIECLSVVSALQEGNALLRERLATIKEKGRMMAEENRRLEEEKRAALPPQKRKYSKRRKDLQKDYACLECVGRYSSKIALNNHLRKKHRPPEPL